LFFHLKIGDARLATGIWERRLIRQSHMKSLPNILSLLRIIIAPILLYVSWNGNKPLFIVLLVFSLLTDAVDGFIARKFELSTTAGAKLDSIGDMATYLTVPLCAWWLWPEILKREAAYVVVTIGGYVLPLLAGFLKFHKLPSYHTYGAKIAAIIMSFAIFLLFMIEFTTIFKFAAIFQAMVAVEEISITLVLPELRNNVKSIWHVIYQQGL
jgi:CDP-diacylglycerol--glycerol-3-phosphate 3-phosphatidyltransferase